MEKSHKFNKTSEIEIEKTRLYLEKQFPQVDISMIDNEILLGMNGYLLNRFIFIPNTIGNIKSIYIYGINLSLYLNSINNKSLLFHFKVNSVILNDDSEKEFLDVELIENIKLCFAKIIDKGECFSSIIDDSFYNWKNEIIKSKAGKAEWNKHNFYPQNGMVGEIVDTFENELWRIDVYVLLVDDYFYIPMSRKGIKLINEGEYKKNIILSVKKLYIYNNS